MNFDPESSTAGASGFQPGDRTGETGIRALFAPLLDLVLILLALAVVAMATSREERAIDSERVIRLTLAASDQAVPARRGLREIVVNIDAAGRLFLNGQIIELAELAERFERAAKNFGETDGVLIRADGATPHRHIVGVLTACRRAGLRAVSFATQSARPPGNGKKTP